jgi:hypothetical protein
MKDFPEHHQFSGKCDGIKIFHSALSPLIINLFAFAQCPTHKAAFSYFSIKGRQVQMSFLTLLFRYDMLCAINLCEAIRGLIERRKVTKLYDT